MGSLDTDHLAGRIARGDRAALARGLSILERGGEAARPLASHIWTRAGEAYTVGITGAPGAGKSTLTNQLVRHFRDGSSDEVAVLAVDPSSPFSGGAILGDSVRMSDHFLDEGVFIRSMASRGALGGLSAVVPEAVRLLSAGGFRWIVVETVGVGQVEVDIASAADTTVVVTNPGWGDAVQASKAGLLEVADVLVVNKGDRPGAADTEADLRNMLMLRPRAEGDWIPPVVVTSAVDGTGLDALVAAIRGHRDWQLRTGRLVVRRRGRIRDELRRVVLREVVARVDARITPDVLETVVDEVLNGATSATAAAEGLVAPLLPDSSAE